VEKESWGDEWEKVGENGSKMIQMDPNHNQPVADYQYQPKLLGWCPDVLWCSPFPKVPTEVLFQNLDSQQIQCPFRNLSATFS